MNRRKIGYRIFLIIICILSGACGYIAGHTGIKKDLPENDASNIESTAVSQSNAKITPSTKMVYEYYYPQTGKTNVNEDVPPYFMVGLTLSDMKRLYSDWEILSFAQNEVDMRKTINGSDEQKYIIGEKDGFITIYYDDGDSGMEIKEVTDIDTNGFSNEEKERLKAGIRVQGDDELNRALENYTS